MRPPLASVQVHRPANPCAYMCTCTHIKTLSEDHKGWYVNTDPKVGVIDGASKGTGSRSPGEEVCSPEVEACLALWTSCCDYLK